MASRKGFRPPVKKQGSSATPPVQVKSGRSRSPKPLSNSQYEDIFDAVVYKNDKSHGNGSPDQADSHEINASVPRESASLQNSQSQQTDATAPTKITADTVQSTKESDGTESSDPNKPAPTVAVDSSESTLGSETSSALGPTSRPKFKKPKTLREALKVIETNSQFSTTLSQLGGSSNSLAIHEHKLSQPPAHLNQRQRLQWLQDRRGVGMWIQCDYCKKWRWSDLEDPVDVPKRWTCKVNPDTAYNQCSIPEKPISVYIEEDLIHNDFTAGSIVWAKLYGYPWWPAMVDDCPNTEQYYWLDGYSDIPLFYHVVFFDHDQNEVTRNWMPTRCVLSFKHQPDLDKRFPVKPCYRARVAHAKRQATVALALSIRERLKRHSFLTRWTRAIVTPPPSDSDREEAAAFSEPRSKRKRKRGKRTGTPGVVAATRRKREENGSEEEEEEEETMGSGVVKGMSRKRKSNGSQQSEVLETADGSKRKENGTQDSLASVESGVGVLDTAQDQQEYVPERASGQERKKKKRQKERKDKGKENQRQDVELSVSRGGKATRNQRNGKQTQDDESLASGVGALDTIPDQDHVPEQSSGRKLKKKGLASSKDRGKVKRLKGGESTPWRVDNYSGGEEEPLELPEDNVELKASDRTDSKGNRNEKKSKRLEENCTMNGQEPKDESTRTEKDSSVSKKDKQSSQKTWRAFIEETAQTKHTEPAMERKLADPEEKSALKQADCSKLHSESTDDTFDKLKNQMEEITGQCAADETSKVVVSVAMDEKLHIDDAELEQLKLVIRVDEFKAEEDVKLANFDESSSMESFTVDTQYVVSIKEEEAKPQIDDGESSDVEVDVVNGIEGSSNITILDGISGHDSEDFTNEVEIVDSDSAPVANEIEIVGNDSVKIESEVEIIEMEEHSQLEADSDDETQIDKVQMPASIKPVITKAKAGSGRPVMVENGVTAVNTAKKQHKRKPDIQLPDSTGTAKKKHQKQSRKEPRKMYVDSDEEPQKTDSEEAEQKPTINLSKAKKPKLSRTKAAKSTDEPLRVKDAKRDKPGGTGNRVKQPESSSAGKHVVKIIKRTGSINVVTTEADSSSANSVTQSKKKSKKTSFQPPVRRPAADSESLNTPDSNSDQTQSSSSHGVPKDDCRKSSGTFSLHSSFCNVDNQSEEYLQELDDFYKICEEIRSPETGSSSSAGAAVVPNSEEKLMNIVQKLTQDSLPFDSD